MRGVQDRMHGSMSNELVPPDGMKDKVQVGFYYLNNPKIFYVSTFTFFNHHLRKPVVIIVRGGGAVIIDM